MAHPKGAATTHGWHTRRSRHRDRGRGPGRPYRSLEQMMAGERPDVVLTGDLGAPNWPRRSVAAGDKPIAHPRAVSRRTADAKAARYYLKAFGSRPAGRTTADRKRAKAQRWADRLVARALARSAA